MSVRVIETRTTLELDVGMVYHHEGLGWWNRLYRIEKITKARKKYPEQKQMWNVRVVPLSWKTGEPTSKQIGGWGKPYTWDIFQGLADSKWKIVEGYRP